MNITRFLPAALGLALAVFAIAPARAVVLAQHQTGNSTTTGIVGQSFTVGGSGSFNNIVFNFYDANTAPMAPGTGYLLSQSYAGTAAQLSNLTAGYVGHVVGSAGYYTFGAGVTLSAGTQYFLYTTANPPAAYAVSGGNTYTGGTAYTVSGSEFTPFTNVDHLFFVWGDSVIVSPPPPSNAPDGGSVFALLGLAFAGLAAVRRMVCA
ncbi:MAG: VPDSG-CTERM sorting domain-containing protein [Opitutaceae bacterium]|nr:VPDSG-CTERM sorting domain-containing protein [Opitutaceae bacterium]